LDGTPRRGEEALRALLGLQAAAVTRVTVEIRTVPSGGLAMPGRRWKDFRSGDWNEELGILLLKAVAAVAPVPRQEDFGLDAIATLLRDDDTGDYLLTEESFYVQLKSDSERKVKYAGHGVSWLKNLQLPFLIGQVDKKDASLALYPTHRLSQVLLEGPHKEIHLYFGSVNESKGGTDQRYAGLGPPLLCWTTYDVAREDFAPWAYSILKPYLEAEQRNVKYRNIRYCEPITWETNQIPRCANSHMIFGSTVSDDDLYESLRSMTPHLHKFAACCMTKKDRQAMEIVLRMVDYMRGNGIDPDPNNIFATLYREWDTMIDPPRS
jgi:hypothetical protein